jgi:hypothetical protein
MRLTNFIQQKSYEHIVQKLRRHPFTYLPTLFFFALLLAIPPLLYLMLQNLFPQILETALVQILGILFFSIYYLSIALFFYTSFITFYLDLLIITNDRLIDINQDNLFSRRISEMDLHQVEDVTSEVRGFFPSLFNYGTLTIQNASAVVKFIVPSVKNPSKLRDMILTLADEDRKYHTHSEQPTTNNLLK